MQTPLSIVSSGIVCSVGLSAPAACAAIHASLDNFKETLFVDESGEPIIGAAIPPGVLGVPGEDDGSIVGGDSRLARMVALAVSECVSGLHGINFRRTALLLVGPEEERSALSPDGPERCVGACEEELGDRLHPASRAFRTGSPGLVDALTHASELMSQGDVQRVLVAGVDSYINAEDINAALLGERLRTSDSSDGFIPGEAAGCVLVMPSGKASSAGASKTTLAVAGLATAQEPDSWSSGKANTGRGLANAMRQALGRAGMPAHEIHYLLSDCSGESFFFDESAYAWGRLLRAPRPPGYAQLVLASALGEIGAAVGPLMLALALDIARRGWAAGPNFLLNLSATGSLRGATVVVS